MFSNITIFILFYVLIISSVLGYGILISSFSKKLKISNDFGYIGLIGFFFLIFYSYLSSFFIKHDLLHNSLIIFFGAISFFLFTFKKLKFFKKEYLNLVIIFSVLFLGVLIFKNHDDFPYYHFPYSYHLTQNELTIGIGHLNLGFRTPSSVFYLNSLFYLPLIKFYLFNMPAILILGFSNLILIEKIFKNISKINYKFIIYFSLLVFIFINVFFYRIAEHGTDRSAQILIFILIIEVLSFINLKEKKNIIISKIYILIGLIVALKAFYILYVLFLLIVLYQIIKDKNLLFAFNKLLKNIYFIPLIILVSFIFLTNFFNSGCIIYPLSFTCFENIIWAIDKKEVVELNNWYEQWSKAGAGPNFRVENPEEYIKYFNWVENWVDKYFFNKVSDYLLGLTTLIIICFLNFYSLKKVKHFNNFEIKSVLLLLFVLFIEWFYNHPSLRYGGYSIISSIIFIYFSLRFSKYYVNKKKIKKKFKILIAISLLIFLTRNIDRIFNEVSFYSYKPLSEVFYNMNQSHYFRIENSIKELKREYNQCKINIELCNQNSKIKVTKQFKKYIFYAD